MLTADRPHEVRYSGANQTIDQVKMYGDHVLWSFDLSVPQADPPALTVRALKTLAARAYGLADGVVKGPVHLNFPFRQPLEPEAPPLPQVTALERPTVQMERGVIAPTANQIAQLVAIIHQHERAHSANANSRSAGSSGLPACTGMPACQGNITVDSSPNMCCGGTLPTTA